MDDKFKKSIPKLVGLFNLSPHTIGKWPSMESRQSHCSLLLSALDCVESGDEFYAELLESERTFEDIASLLGIGPVFKMPVGINSGTLRLWANSSEHKKMLLATMLGYHWQMFSDAAGGLGQTDIRLLLSQLDELDIERHQFLSVYKASPENFVKLLQNANKFVNTKQLSVGK